jgi:uncharacterized protein
MTNEPVPCSAPVDAIVDENALGRKPVDGPISGQDRIGPLDTLRGVAVLGILSVNILTFGLTAAGAQNPAHDFGDFTPPNLISWFATYVLFDGKFRAIFSMLFGASGLLFLERAEARGLGIRAADLYYRRTMWLIVFGLIHAYLVWWGDILFWYGVFGLVLFPFRNGSPAFLLIAGLLLLGLETPIAVVEHVNLVSVRDKALEAGRKAAKGEKLTDEELIAWGVWGQKKRELNPLPSELAREIETQRSGWWKAFLLRLDRAVLMQSTGVYRSGLTDVCSMMLIGMGLMKLGVFSARLSAGWYRWLALAGYAVGLPLSTLDGIQQVVSGFDLLEFGLFHGCTFPISRLAVALGHVGVIMLICQSRWFVWLTTPLAAVGRLALTNYILQSVLCTAFFDGWGLGRFATLERYQLASIVVIVWGVELVGSVVWLSVFEFGPIEWGWRALTYWRLPAILTKREARIEPGQPGIEPRSINQFDKGID